MGFYLLVGWVLGVVFGGAVALAFVRVCDLGWFSSASWWFCGGLCGLHTGWWCGLAYGIARVCGGF